MSDPVPPEEQFYSTKKVTELFDITVETVQNWINRGILEAIKVNGLYRISRASVLKLGNSKYGPEA
jgi:excisionase family DNA binding protein